MATSFLPMFPLNIVVYPGEQLNLHVFEPRYKQLVQECYEKKAPFGIPVFMKNKVSSYGTEVELLSIEKVFPEGEMDIKTRGKRIFTVSDFYRQAPKKLYPGGMIHYMDNINDQDAALQLAIAKELQTLYEALKINRQANFKSSYEIAHHIGFSKDQEFEFLQMIAESDRQAMILSHLRQIVPVIIESERLKEKVRLNGHFKNLGELKF